jgi:hypothetical protein
VPIVGRDLGGMRFHHQVADRQHKTLVVDDDAGSFALAAEYLDRAPVRVDEGFHLDDSGQKLIGRELLCEGYAAKHGRSQDNRQGSQPSTHALSFPIDRTTLR